MSCLKLELTPWIDEQRLKREGALVVWWRSPAHPPEAYRWLTGDRVDGIEMLNLPHLRHGEPPRIIYTIVPPR
jgi:hypothetical protein